MATIGLGLAAVAGPGYINLGRDTDLPADRTVEAMRSRAHELLDQAYAAGVRYVDVARSYGRAEEFLARWLQAHPEATEIAVRASRGAGFRLDVAHPTTVGPGDTFVGGFLAALALERL